MNENKSTHRCEVVPVVMRKHENADTLSVIPVYGYTYVGRTAAWQDVDEAVWFPPDTLVDTSRPEFIELKNDAKFFADGETPKTVARKEPATFARVKAKKLRGIVSYGYMIPAPEGVAVGDDLAEKYGATHYDPPEPSVAGGPNRSRTGGEIAPAPAGTYPKYDVDSFQRYAKLVFTDGEPVAVTEKIHGSNGRWLYKDGEFHCGSRTEWKKEFASPIPVPSREELLPKLRKLDMSDEELEARYKAVVDSIEKKNASPLRNLWWEALERYPAMKVWLKDREGYTLYGEVYGAQKGFPYDTKVNGSPGVAIFDILRPDCRWMSAQEARDLGKGLPWVPVVAWNEPFDFDKLVAMAETKTILGCGNHISEGIVVVPMTERWDETVGRVKLKIVSVAYFEGK